MAEMAAGTHYTAKLLRQVERAGTTTRRSPGSASSWATQQCADLLHNGVRGIHFYTLTGRPPPGRSRRTSA